MAAMALSCAGEGGWSCAAFAGERRESRRLRRRRRRQLPASAAAAAAAAAVLGGCVARSRARAQGVEETPVWKCEGFDCESYPPGLFPDFDCDRMLPPLRADDAIDWGAFRRIFEEASASEWGDQTAVYLNAFMDADEDSLQRWKAGCPLGVLSAEMLLYSYACFQDDVETAAGFAYAVKEDLKRLPLRIMMGSRWPLFAILTSEKLRKVPIGRSIANSDFLNCLSVPEPALNWYGFLHTFDDDRRKDWFAESIRYVHSWQMHSIPDELYEECPLGTMTAKAIRAFSCITSESTCYLENARYVERWLANEPNIVEILAHSRWPLSIVLNHMARGARHKFHLDFTEAELIGSRRILEGVPAVARKPDLLRAGVGDMQYPTVMEAVAPWMAALTGVDHSQSFTDVLAMLPRLGPGPEGAESIVYVSMVFGTRFNKHIPRFSARARALGRMGERLILFTLDEEAYTICMASNGQRCVRGTPGIMNKFTFPLVLNHLGLDVVWIDLDVFLMKDPTPFIAEHASRGPYDILITGSFESDCICNGIVYFRSTEAVRSWLLNVVLWMYHHPYEHDQKTFSAFLNYTETVQREPLDFPVIPPWDTLEPINQFVTPDTFEGNGWTGELDDIVLYHFLNGESDIGSDLDPSGTWTREHGNFEDAGNMPPPSRKDLRRTGGKMSLMDLFYGQDDALYSTPKAAHEYPALRRALLASRKEFRRTDLLGKPCGPMTEVLAETAAAAASGGAFDAASRAELLQRARAGTKQRIAPRTPSAP